MEQNLEEKIHADFISAVKQKERLKTDTLRMLNAAIHNRLIEKKAKSGEKNLSDDEILEVILKEAKKRKEAMEAFQRGGREELADKEKKELNVLSVYLPKEMTREEIEEIISKAIKDTASANPEDFGKVMKEVMKEAKGRADAKVITEIIKEKLSK